MLKITKRPRGRARRGRRGRRRNAVRIVSRTPGGHSMRTWHGPLTVAALSRELAHLDSIGLPSWLAVDDGSPAGHRRMELGELVQRGLVFEEPAVAIERAIIEAVERGDLVERTLLERLLRRRR